jgi:rubrerythrin
LIEQEGVAFYESLDKYTKNEKIKKLAKTLARVEKSHQKRFEQLSQDLEKRKRTKSPSAMTPEIRQYLLALIDHRIFLSPDQARIAAENLADENEAVDLAVRFEKENILLLIECRELVRGAARKLIETFIGQEKAHVRSLEKIRKQLAQS